MERSLVYKGGGHMKKSGFLLLAMVFFFSLSIGLFAADTQATSEIIFKPGPGKNDGSDNGSISGGKDTTVSGSTPTQNYGTATSMAGSPQSNCNPAQGKAYIQFDVSSLPSNVQQVFLGATHIPHTTYCYSNCNADFYFYPVAQSWNEMALTYNTMPSEGAAVYGPINIMFPNNFGTREYDITTIYKNWKNGSVPNHGLAIYSPTVGCNNAAVIFNVHTSDDTDPNVRPYLRILSSSPPPPTSSLSDTGWKISGNFTAAIKFPNYVELSVKLPKLETYWNTLGTGETFYFHGDGTFEDLILSLLPLLAGNMGVDLPLPTWQQNGLSFAIDVTEFSAALADALQSILGDIATIDREPTKPPSYTGKVDSKGASISGKLAINYNLSVVLGSVSPMDGTLSLTMSFKGTPLQSGAMSARAAFESASWSLGSKAKSEGALRFSSAIKNMLSEIRALVPSKGDKLLKSH
jgi:hypothetical protein